MSISVSSYTGSSDATAPRQTQVQDTMNTLGIAVMELDKIISELEKRLDPVLRPSAPTPSSDMQKEKNTLVQLASCIDNERGHIRDAVARIEYILSRLEL